MHMYKLSCIAEIFLALFFIYEFLQLTLDGRIIFLSANSSWLIQCTCSLSDMAWEATA